MDSQLAVETDIYAYPNILSFRASSTKELFIMTDSSGQVGDDNNTSRMKLKIPTVA
jgi:hypothetical protein